jgi:hypothetical protein
MASGKNRAFVAGKAMAIAVVGLVRASIF